MPEGLPEGGGPAMGPVGERARACGGLLEGLLGPAGRLTVLDGLPEEGPERPAGEDARRRTARAHGPQPATGDFPPGIFLYLVNSLEGAVSHVGPPLKIPFELRLTGCNGGIPEYSNFIDPIAPMGN